MDEPNYWMYETSGVLRPAVEAYLRNEPMTLNQIGAMRAYLRQWIGSPVWHGGEEIEQLRLDVESIVSRDDIHKWLAKADELAIDPL